VLVRHRPAPESEPTLGTVKTITGGGLSLLIDNAVIDGAVLSVEWPADMQPAAFRIPLVVLRCAERPEGEWLLVCQFAQELSEAELAALGAQRLQTAQLDQRSWVRFACQTEVNYRVLFSADPSPAAAILTSISPIGLALQAPRSVKVGTLLSVEVLTEAKASFTLLASVARVGSLDDGEWLLGCNVIGELREPILA
jgi:hypothetical protein